MTINISDFERLIKGHMDSQPYEIECSKCDRELELDVVVDADFDLKIKVYPCGCQKEE